MGREAPKRYARGKGRVKGHHPRGSVDPSRRPQPQQLEARLELLHVPRVLAERDLPRALALPEGPHLLEVALVQPLAKLLRRVVGAGADALARQGLRPRPPPPPPGSSGAPRPASRARA